MTVIIVVNRICWPLVIIVQRFIVCVQLWLVVREFKPVYRTKVTDVGAVIPDPIYNTSALFDIQF